MASVQQEKGRPLPKFGEWDVNNPSSADGFTVIFAKARDEKKAKGVAPSPPPPPAPSEPPSPTFPNKKNWFCCFAPIAAHK